MVQSLEMIRFYRSLLAVSASKLFHEYPQVSTASYGWDMAIAQQWGPRCQFSGLIGSNW